MNKSFNHRSKNVTPNVTVLSHENWPDDFDFETDEFCQKIALPYIEKCLIELQKYDDKRNLKSDYLFHVHAFDAAEDVYETAIELGLDHKVANNLYHATLIHDIGKLEFQPTIWDSEKSPSPAVKTEKRKHVDYGAQRIKHDFQEVNHPFIDLAIDIAENHHKQLNTLQNDETLSAAARLVAIVEDFDGRAHLRAHQIKQSLSNDIPSTLERQQQKCEGWFDTNMYEAFKTIKMKQHETLSPPQIDIKTEDLSAE